VINISLTHTEHHNVGITGFDGFGLFGLVDLHPSMAFAKWLPCFHEETLPFQVLLAQRAVEAL